MRTVRARSFREYFETPEELPFEELGPNWTGVWTGLFYRRRRWFNSLGVFLVLALAAAIIAFTNRAGLVLLLSVPIFLWSVFLKTRAIARGVTVVRNSPTIAIERERLKVTYAILNTSAFPAGNLLLKDHFTGSRSGDREIWIPGPIAPGERIVQEIEWTCDGGMGDHRFGSVSLEFSDALNVFHFSIEENETASVQIRPEYIPLKEFRIPTSYRSSSLGLYESPVSGQSSNILGIREYVPGDALKQIHWKLSARHFQLVVKELENSINTDVTLCLDMDPANHLGLKDASTWEYAKDIAVALVHECLGQAARFQFATQGKVLGFGSGEDHSAWVIRTISKLTPGPCSAPLLRTSRPLLEEIDSSIPSGSAVLLIACPYSLNPATLARHFQLLQARAVRLVMIWIDGTEFSDVFTGSAVRSALFEMNARAQQNLSRLLDIGGQLEIPSFVVGKREPIRKSLSAPRVQ